MELNKLNELDDVEKWEYVLNHIAECELMDDDDIYFVFQDKDTMDDFELHFNEPFEADSNINYLLKALGFESHNY